MADARPQRPSHSRFAPARLRAAALREEIEATQAELGVTVDALSRREGIETEADLGPEPAIDTSELDLEPDQWLPASWEEPPDAHEEDEVPEAAEPEPEPELTATASAPEPEAPAPVAPVRAERAPRPVAATALTFALGLGAGLLLRRR